MPPRSKVDLLPEDVRQALEQRLIAQAFSGYEALEAWLEEKGFEIAKSTLHRWGSRFEERVASLKMATDQAKAIVAASPDDEGAMTDALLRLVQEKLFSIMMELEVDPKKVNLGSLAKSIAQLGRASIAQKKHMVEMRTKIAADLKDLEKAGFDKNTLEAVSNRISIYLPANAR
jgi:hypothetical protein